MTERAVSIRCCGCGDPGVVFYAGRETAGADVGDLFVPLERGAPDQAWCLACAALAGWPNYKSEKRGKQDQ